VLFRQFLHKCHRGTIGDPLGLYVSGLTADALPGQTNLGGEDVFVAKLPAPDTIAGTLTHATTGLKLRFVWMKRRHH